MPDSDQSANLIRATAALEGEAGDPRALLYQHTALCQTCLPYRDPGEVGEWERRNGAVHLRVRAGEAFDPAAETWVRLGLPYGPKPRLILAYLNAEALRTGSPEIEVGDSLTAFVRRLGLNLGGRSICAVKDQLARLAAAEVRLAVAYGERETCQVNAHIVSGFDLWMPKDERQRVLWPTTVRLSLDYYASLRTRAVPLEERALAALADSASALDVYAWLAQRLCRIAPGPGVLVPWPALRAQFGAGYKSGRKFRQNFRHTLSRVLEHYLGAGIVLDDRGAVLRYSPPPVSERPRLARL